MKSILILLFVFLCTALWAQKIDGNKDSTMLYLLVGTYTTGNSQGIYVYKFNIETGKAEYVNETKVENPSYMVVSKDERFVYAVSENAGEKAMVNAFSFDKKAGKLTVINAQPTHGDDPCYINIDYQNRFIITANYSGGSVSVFPLSKDGSLQPVNQLMKFDSMGHHQKKSHIHCVLFSPNQQYLFATDLGKDCIYQFRINNKVPFLVTDYQTLPLENGSGARHLVFHPNRKFAYSINELSGKVTVFHYNHHSLQPIQYVVSDTSKNPGNKGSGDIHISPDSKFLYTSNRETVNNIAIFKIDSIDGKLSLSGFQTTGLHPRNFIITPNGKYLLVANMKSNNIQVFEMNKETGLLVENKSNLLTNIDRPVCLKFVGSR